MMWSRKMKEKKKAFPVKRAVSFPTCLKETRSSMCVQISITAGEFPSLRGPVGGKSDRVRENIQSLSAVKVCCSCWGIPPSINFLYLLLLHSGSRRFTGAYNSCHWVTAGLHPGQVVWCIAGPHKKKINNHLHLHSEFPVCHTCQFLDCRREPGVAAGNPHSHWKPLETTTILLWGDSVDHCMSHRWHRSFISKETKRGGGCSKLIVKGAKFKNQNADCICIYNF